MRTRLIQRTQTLAKESIEYEYRDAEYEYEAFFDVPGSDPTHPGCDQPSREGLGTREFFGDKPNPHRRIKRTRNNSQQGASRKNTRRDGLILSNQAVSRRGDRGVVGQVCLTDPAAILTISDSTRLATLPVRRLRAYGKPRPADLWYR